MFICQLLIFIFNKKNMEKKEATKVGCQSCKTDKGVIRTQKFLIGFGIIMFLLSVYGTISLVQDIRNLF